MLIENNIFDSNRGHIFVGYGAAGCVIGYNYFRNSINDTTSPSVQKMDVCFHSSFPEFNLVEGNIGIRLVDADSFHGNSNYETVFRNWAQGMAPGKTGALTCIELDIYQRYFNIVGNVLGYPAVLSDIGVLRNPTGVGIYEKLAPATFSYTNSFIEYLIGYVGEGGGTSTSDSMVSSTLLRHGNFDYVTNSTKWDSSIADQTLPNSLYLSAQPGWWPSTVPWPAIGPDLTPMVSAIPAQLRLSGLNGSGPPSPPTNLRITH
jgi:hypothetical protein